MFSRRLALRRRLSHQAFEQGLRDLGYVKGRNIAIEYRWDGGKLKAPFGFGVLKLDQGDYLATAITMTATWA